MAAHCPHCSVNLCDPIAWSDVGRLAQCPACASTFLFRYPMTAAERESIVLSAMLAALLAGPISDRLHRWVRAWWLIARAYNRDGKRDEAKRALRFVRQLERCGRNSGIARAVR